MPIWAKRPKKKRRPWSKDLRARLMPKTVFLEPALWYVRSRSCKWSKLCTDTLLIPAYIISVILSICLHKKKVDIILVIPQRPIEATIEAMVIGATALAEAEADWRTAGEIITLTILLRIKGELMANSFPTVRKIIDFQKSLIESLWKMNGLM